MIERIRALYKKFREEISYLFWGGMTTLVSYGSYFLFTRGFHLDPLVSNVLSWICAVAFAFIVNKIFVFHSASWKPATVAGEAWKFVSARIFSFVLEMAIMFLGVKILHFNDLIVKVIATVIIVILNYFLSKFLIFRKAHGDGEAGAADGE